MTVQHPPWYLEPYEGESISHYLGRLRRKESISAPSVSGLSRAIGLGIALARWEKFRFIPFPSQIELEALGKIVGLEIDRLTKLLPARDKVMNKPSTIRFCPACYIEAPYHRIEWQYQSTAGCDRHQLKILCKCPGCERNIQIPALWAEPKCHHCGMPFKRMVKHQKPYQI